jgi:hypothetical protein
LYSIGQALVTPNWVAGPSNLIAFAILCALRVRAEERMMVEEFGDDTRRSRHGRSVLFLAFGRQYLPADRRMHHFAGSSASRRRAVGLKLPRYG